MSGLDDTETQKKFDSAARDVFKFSMGTQDDSEMQSLVEACEVLGENLFMRLGAAAELARRNKKRRESCNCACHKDIA